MQEEEFNRKDYYAMLGISRNVEFSFGKITESKRLGKVELCVFKYLNCIEFKFKTYHTGKKN